MKRWTSTVAVATALLMAMALPAFADEHEAEPEGFSVDYNADEHIIVFGFNVDCSLEDVMGTWEIGEDGTITFVPEVEDEVVVSPGFGFQPAEEEAAPLDGCTSVLVEGPNGQVNHGSVVSNTVHALKLLKKSGELEGPFGQAVKEVAQSKWGKGDQQVKVKDVEEGEATSSELETAEAKQPKVKKNNGKAKGRP